MKAFRVALFLLMAALGADVAHAQSYPTKFDASSSSTNSTEVIIGKTQVRSLVVSSAAAAVNWLKLYDVATAPVCSTATVVFKAAIPFSSSNATLTSVPIPDGLQFYNGLGFCITANQADTDSTNATSGAIVVDFGIKQ